MRKKELAALPIMETKSKKRLMGIRVDKDTLVFDCWNGGIYQGRYCLRDNGEYLALIDGLWCQRKLCDVLRGRTWSPYNYAGNGEAFDTEQEQLAEAFLQKMGHTSYSLENAVYYAEQRFNTDARYRREQRKREKIARRMDEVPVLPDGFVPWCRAVPFEGKQFFFKGKAEDVYHCTACGKTHRMKGLKQNQEVVCSRTGITAKVDKRRDKRTASHHTMVIQWMNQEKRERVARHFLIDSVWTKAGQEIYAYEQVRYVLKDTGCNEYYYGRWNCADEFEQEWDEKNPLSLHCYSEFCYPEGVAELLAGTVYEHLGIPEMADKGWKLWYNKIMVCHGHARAMEYMAKGGYRRLAADISNNLYWGSDTVKYRGATMQEVLKVDKQRANRLRQADGGLIYLKWLQWEIRTGKRLPESTVRWLEKNHLTGYELDFIKDRMSPEQVMHYLERQAAESKKGIHWLLTEWKDTLRMAGQLKMNTADAIVYRPRDLIGFHDRLVQKINQMDAKRQEREYNRKYKGINAVCKKLKKYEWCDGTYAVVAPASARDILAEGRTLNHCVTAERYFERMAKEESYILFLRHADKPDVPWYTLEVEPGGVIRQKRTHWNRQEKDLDAAKDFLKRWQQEIIRRLGERERGLQKVSAAARIAEIDQLRRDGVVVHGGELTGTLLADVLLADLMEVGA